MNVLGIETSCDDTSVAILSGTPHERVSIRGLEIVTQKNIHEKFGGIVPENASRAHLEVLDPLIARVLSQSKLQIHEIDLCAVTHAPGLLGSLIVGVTYGKSLAASLGIPCQAIHHLEGHLLAPLLSIRTAIEDWQKCDPFPALGLVVSGGHSHFYSIEQPGFYVCLGKTVDDAAGECFDKTARLLGLPFPGGPALNCLAQEFIESKTGSQQPPSSPMAQLSSFQFPRPRPGGRWEANGDFSFSGLKTAVKNKIQELRFQSPSEIPLETLRDFAYGIHEAVGEVIIRKSNFHLRSKKFKSFFLTGGVAANSLLRHWCQEFLKDEGVQFFVAPPQLCTDNAAMIAFAALEKSPTSALIGFEVMAHLELNSSLQ